MASSTEQIVYEQSVRAIDQQVRQLDELRSRTAILLAASGVIAGFLGRSAVDDGVGAFGVLATLFFVATAFACVWILLPRWDSWAFAISARKLTPHFLHTTDPEPPEALYRYLADQIETDYHANKARLEGLYGWFTAASILLAVDVVLWIGALALD